MSRQESVIQTRPEKSPDQRPECAQFWDKRFQEGVMPWDAGQAPVDLQDFAAARSPLATLIPGCGSAWEAAYLGRLGWPVTAIDFSPAALAAARSVLGAWPGELLCADFFTWRPPRVLDLIYERAFLCALPRKCWSDWARRMAELLPAGGLLAGFFFVGEGLKGPPFAIEPSVLHDLLAPNFQRVEYKPARDSVAVFAGQERWQVWRRR